MLNWIAGLILLIIKLGVVLGVMLFFAAYLGALEAATRLVRGR